MSEVLTKVVVDCSTGVTEIVPLTAEETERVAQAEALATLKASAKAKLIAGEPLTAEEADTLVI